MKYIIDSVKTGGYFKSVSGWTYTIITGSRCSGLVSRKVYSSYEGAVGAAERMVKKLGGGCE